MSHIKIDKQKALKKWGPVLENMGVSEERAEWMSELAEFHSINENAYANATTAGMGNVVSANPGSLPGLLGFGSGFGGTSLSGQSSIGSGDVGQNLLPVSMKIAAQTIGLDLVAVKPSPGPKIDLLYIDFQYDDLNTDGNLQRPQVFKLTATGNPAQFATLKTALTNEFVARNPAGASFTQGGLQNGKLYVTVATGSTGYWSASGTVSAVEPTNKGGAVEFLGFSRIDGAPMFKAYRQANSQNTAFTNYPYGFDQAYNTFPATGSMVDGITMVGTVGATSSTVELISALEDHLPGFSANWTNNTSSGDYPMSRSTDDNTYAGVIGPKVSSKSIAIGSIEVATALRRTEIEDIKANTGMDIVQKMESVLVNELSQTISRQIVNKVFQLGEQNRQTSPLAVGNVAVTSTASTIFDLNTIYASSMVGGETTHAVQRKLITKIAHASNYIATEGRVGPAQYAVTNGALAASLMDIVGYTVNPVKSKMNGQGQLYPVGQIGDISIYVDPYMKYNDNRIVLGRKNNPDQPGLIFIPYLMAQSISVISEATMAPKMLLRSRYAIADVGFFPQKQFMTIVVTDSAQLLN